MKKTDKRRKGFTLIELIVVIAILAILAAIAVPNFIGMTRKANNATEVSAAAQYATAINIANTLAATDDEKITTIPADAEALAILDGKLLAQDLAVTVDVDAGNEAEFIANVLNRLKIVGDVFMVDSDRKDNGPFAAPTTVAP